MYFLTSEISDGLVPIKMSPMNLKDAKTSCGTHVVQNVMNKHVQLNYTTLLT